MRLASALGLSVVLTGCVAVHHVQVGEIDAQQLDATPFVIELDSAGVDVVGAVGAANIPVVSDAMAYVNMGPRTGRPLASTAFVNGVQEALEKKCPGGRVTGLQVRRSSRQVKFVSSEVVRLTGWCVLESTEEG